MTLAIKSHPDDSNTPRKKHSTLSKSTYYKLQYATELMPLLDAMIANKEDRKILYEDYPTMAASSLYIKVCQSFKFILDHLDSAGKYASVRPLIGIIPEDNGVALRWKIKFDLLATSNKGVVSLDWRKACDSFLEGDTDEIILNGLDLTEKEQDMIRTLFDGLELEELAIDARSILVRRKVNNE